MLKDGLEKALGNNVFLGADDLRSLADLQMHVKESDVLLLIQTKSCMERPWVIVEVLTAIDENVRPQRSEPSSFAAALLKP